MFKKGLIILLCLLIVLCTGCSSNNSHDVKGEVVKAESLKGEFVLYNCTIIDGTGAEPIKNGTILINNGKISKVYKDKNINDLQVKNKINLNGRYVLPGFINAHVHDSYNEKQLQKWLKSGITTVRDLAPRINDFIEKRDGFNKNNANSRIVSATPIITAAGGYGGAYVDSPESAKKLTLSYIDKGVDVVKIAIEDDCEAQRWTMLTLDEIKSITEIAHSKNIKVAAHVTHAGNLQSAIDGKVDDLVHMVVDSLDDNIINKIVKENIYWIPTLELWHGVDKAYPVDYEDCALQNLSKFYKKGGKIALGTDFGGFRSHFDDEFPITEIRLMKKAGMSNMDIILAGTKNAAHVCDKENEIGTLEEGKNADILVVDGNPLDNIESLQKTYIVVHNGIGIMISKAK